MDRRALLIGTIGGLVFSGALAWTYYGPEWTVLDTTYGTQKATNGLMLCTAFGCLGVPGVVSALARDRPFAWGLLPLGVFLAVIEVAQGTQSGWDSVFRTLPEIVLIAGICLLISSGPVTFARTVLDKRRQAAEEQARWEQRQAARRPPEEVWPPPPDDAV